MNSKWPTYHFNARQAFQQAQVLTFPRAAGTEGEKKATANLKQELEKLGLTVFSQSFAFSPLPDLLSKLIPFSIGCTIWLVICYFALPSWLVFIILVMILILGIIINSLPVSILKLHNILSNRISENIFSEIPPQSKVKNHLVFLAHYDSKSQILPMALRISCYLVLFGATLVLGGIHFLFLWGIDFINPIVLPIFATSALLSGCLLLINLTRNHSPGASDNAAGIAVLLELARIFCKIPLNHIHLTFLFTGAEEYGMAGAFRYIEHFKSSVPRIQFVNIDGVGEDATLGLAQSKTPGRNHDSDLLKGIKCSIRQLDLPQVKERKLIALGFDHLPIAYYGYESVTLYTGNSKTLLRIHSPRDTINFVSQTSLEKIGKVCEVYTRNLDTGS